MKYKIGLLLAAAAVAAGSIYASQFGTTYSPLAAGITAASTLSQPQRDGADWYVYRLLDSRGNEISAGSDANNGKSPATAFKTLSHALTVASSGQVIAIVGGSTIKEELDLVSNYTSLSTLTIRSFGGPVLLDGSDAIPASAWLPTAGQANVYSAPVTLTVNAAYAAANGSGVGYERLYRDDTDGRALKQAAGTGTNAADVLANVGSCYFTSHTYAAAGTSAIVYVNSSTDPRTDGSAYSHVARYLGVFSLAANHNFQGIFSRRAGNNNGSFEIAGMAIDCGATQGSKHAALFHGGIRVDGFAVSECYYPNGGNSSVSGSTLVVANDSNADAKSVRVRGLRAYLTDPSYADGYGGTDTTGRPTNCMGWYMHVNDASLWEAFTLSDSQIWNTYQAIGEVTGARKSLLSNVTVNNSANGIIIDTDAVIDNCDITITGTSHAMVSNATTASVVISHTHLETLGVDRDVINAHFKRLVVTDSHLKSHLHAFGFDSAVAGGSDDVELLNNTLRVASPYTGDLNGLKISNFNTHIDDTGVAGWYINSTFYSKAQMQSVFGLERGVLGNVTMTTAASITVPGFVNTLLPDATSGAITVTTPADHHEFAVNDWKGQAATHNITVTDGGSFTVTMSTNNQTKRFTWSGAAWRDMN